MRSSNSADSPCILSRYYHTTASLTDCLYVEQVPSGIALCWYHGRVGRRIRPNRRCGVREVLVLFGRVCDADVPRLRVVTVSLGRVDEKPFL